MRWKHDADVGTKNVVRWGRNEILVGELRRRLDVLSLTLVTRLAEAPHAELEQTLLEGLGEIGPMLDFDQVTLLADHPEHAHASARLTWHAPDVSLIPFTRIQGACPELMARVHDEQPVEVRRADDRRERAPYDVSSLRALGIHSMLLLPLGLGGTVDGALALVATRGVPRWPSPLTGELRTLCHVLMMGLHRQRGASALAGEPTRMDRRREATGLTDRQLEVLQLLGRGQTIKQIAEHLDISPRTVAFHKARIKETMGATTTAELVRKALEACALDV